MLKWFTQIFTRRCQIMASLIDYDELECKFCGHIGLLPNGGFDVECPACCAEYSLAEDDE